MNLAYENISLEVKLYAAHETVWLTQQQIADLFGVKQPAISKHLSNVFKSGELDQASVHSILEYTAADGKTYKTQFYNLESICNPWRCIHRVYPEFVEGHTFKMNGEFDSLGCTNYKIN